MALSNVPRLLRQSQTLANGAKAAALTAASNRSASTLADSFYNDEQKALKEAAKKLIEAEINPHVDQWERDHAFPAHEVFKKFGQAGFLGVNKPVEYGGQGLDYKYQARYTVL